MPLRPRVWWTPGRRVRGHLEAALDGYLSGWAVDLADPERPLTLEIEVDGRPVTTCVTDRDRPDVVAALGSGGRPGFAVRFSPVGRAGPGSRVHVRLLEVGSRQVVTSLKIPQTEWATSHLAALEALAGGWLSGWIVDLREPALPAVGVISWQGGAQGFVCDMRRRDLGPATADGPALGFCIRVDELCADIADGRSPHLVLSTPSRGGGLVELVQAEAAGLDAAHKTSSGRRTAPPESSSPDRDPAFVVLRSPAARLPRAVMNRLDALAASGADAGTRGATSVQRGGVEMSAVLAWLIDEGYADSNGHDRRIRAGVPAQASVAYTEIEALVRHLPGADVSRVPSAQADPGGAPAGRMLASEQGWPALTAIQQIYRQENAPLLDVAGDTETARVIAGFLDWVRPLGNGLRLLPAHQLDWMRQEVQGSDGPVRLSRFVVAEHQRRPAWREAYDLATARGRAGLVSACAADELANGYGWLLLGTGRTWEPFGEARVFVHDLLTRVTWPSGQGGPGDPPPGHVLRDPRQPFGSGAVVVQGPQRVPGSAEVHVIGLVSHPSAVGATADRSLVALSRAGIPSRQLRLDFRHRPVGRELVHQRGPDGGVAIVHVQPDSLPGAMALGSRFFRGFDKIVGYFAWETSLVPDSLLPALEMVDEVWTLSEFSAAALSQATETPVRVAAPFIDIGARNVLPRKRWGLGADAWVAHFSFDAHSTLARKNPLGALHAFQAAFPGDADVAFLLKVRNFAALQWLASSGEPGSRELLAAVEADSRVVLVTEELEYGHALGMIADSDCYLSLHRAEGFGYALAESMALKVPVVATDYSGSRDFLNAETGWPVEFDLAPVEAHAYPHWQDGMAWAEPRLASAASALREVRSGGPSVASRIDAAEALVGKALSGEQAAARYRDLLKGHL